MEGTKRFNSRLKDEFKNQIDTINEAADTINNNLSQTVADLTANYNLLIENIKNSVSAELSKEVSTSDELTASLSNSFNDIMNENLSTIKTNINQIITNVGSKIANLAKENKNFNDLFSQKIEEIIKTQNTTWQQENESLRNKIISKIGENYKKTQNKFQEKINDFSSQLNELKDEFSETIDNLEEKSKKRLDFNKKFFSDSLMNLNKSLADIFTNIKEKTTSSLESIQETSNTNINEYIENLKNNSSIIETKVVDSFNNLKTNLKSYLRDLQKNALMIYDNKISDGNEIIAKVRDNLESNIESTTNNLKEKVKNPESKLENMIQKSSQNIEKFQKNLEDIIENTMQWITDEYENINTSLRESIEGNIENYEDQSQQSSSTTREKITKTLNEQKSNIKNNFGNIEDRMSKVIEDQTLEIKKEGQNSQEIFSNLAEKQKTLLLEKISEISNDFIGQINKLKEDTSESEILLRNIWQELQKIRRLKETGTWEVKTLTAVIEHIKDMISRTTSSITLLLPDSTKIPFDEISKIKPAIDVQLFTEISNILLKSVEMKPLLKKDNIRIFDIKENFYGAFRDNEEVLIAPDEKEKEKVSGIISVQEGHIDLFFNIIGPTYASRSKEIEK
ncbi:MAG: hypothetical protein EU549_02380 [Promethearchaeota archaeon]|nr:MAG: hypothetical protein EU549_02380 [Candidatus Lokiarchaeota archaeon]